MVHHTTTLLTPWPTICVLQFSKQRLVQSCEKIDTECSKTFREFWLTITCVSFSPRTVRAPWHSSQGDATKVAHNWLVSYAVRRFPTLTSRERPVLITLQAGYESHVHWIIGANDQKLNFKTLEKLRLDFVIDPFRSDWSCTYGRNLRWYFMLQMYSYFYIIFQIWPLLLICKSS